MSILKIIILQASWFICVLIGPLAPLSILSYCLAIYFMDLKLLVKNYPHRHILFSLFVILWGVIQDNLLQYNSLIDIKNGPFWIIGMWIIFIPYYHDIFSYLKEKHWGLLFALGIIGGPLAYRGGASLGAMEFLEPNLAYLIIALSWGIFFPLSIKLYKKYII